jgi:hypothetical protein
VVIGVVLDRENYGSIPIIVIRRGLKPLNARTANQIKLVVKDKKKIKNFILPHLIEKN